MFKIVRSSRLKGIDNRIDMLYMISKRQAMKISELESKLEKKLVNHTGDNQV